MKKGKKGLLEAVGVRLFAWLLVLAECAAITVGAKSPLLDELDREMRRKEGKPVETAVRRV